MTEAEWLASEDAAPMLELLQEKVSNRKLRLFACGWFRWRWRSLDEPRRAIVEIGEWYADGLAESDAVKQAQRQALEGPPTFQATWLTVCDNIPERFRPVMSHEFCLSHGGRSQCCALFRDIFGNPFRPVAFDASWRTSAVVALASQMYESRNFSEMPVLADALEDAGCDNADVIAHCRGPGPHVRGCWVVDLVLGKA